MEELALRPEELKNVRVAAFLDKRARAFPHGWRARYCVLAGNFLFVYGAPTDPKPRRVVCIDDALAEPCERYRARKHAFTLVARSGKVFTFAAESREERDKVRGRARGGPRGGAGGRILGGVGSAAAVGRVPIGCGWGPV